ncbi:hypothetical protein PYCC9005_002286 [Savitreella phatthalungensis]
MVYYFKTASGTAIYMGKDKFENEDLIKYGWENDVWFHVDNLSSAHVYLRLPDYASWEEIPEADLLDCAQLTKANSIDGNKRDNITIIYTPHANLKKSGDMATGQVSFHRSKQVKKVFVKTRENAIVNRLNKTREERINPDLQAELRDHQISKQRVAKELFYANKREEDKRAREMKAAAELKRKGYSDFLTEDAIEEAAAERGSDYDPEEDFM